MRICFSLFLLFAVISLKSCSSAGTAEENSKGTDFPAAREDDTTDQIKSPMEWRRNRFRADCDTAGLPDFVYNLKTSLKTPEAQLQVSADLAAGKYIEEQCAIDSLFCGEIELRHSRFYEAPDKANVFAFGYAITDHAMDSASVSFYVYGVRLEGEILFTEIAADLMGEIQMTLHGYESKDESHILWGEMYPYFGEEYGKFQLEWKRGRSGITFSCTSAEGEPVPEHSHRAFTEDLYGQLNRKGENLLFSPYSLHAALALAWEGADGITEKEFRKVLHAPGSIADMRFDLADWFQETAQTRSATYRLCTANSIWYQQNYAFEQNYMDYCRRFYDAEIQPVDFLNHAEAARSKINAWANEKTEGLIPAALLPGFPGPDTRCVLVNALYMNAPWSWEFSPGATRKESFSLSSGEKVQANMMHQTGYFRYGETPHAQVLEMPYKGNISMLVYLPKMGKELPADSTSFHLNLFDAPESKRVEVSFPSFEMETFIPFTGILEAAGLKSAFSFPDADFRNMCASGELFISEIFQRAVIKVDEKGTEAAAVTVGGMVSGAKMPPPPKPIVFRADHPFLFIIRHEISGAILFMGKVENPNG